MKNYFRLVSFVLCLTGCAALPARAQGTLTNEQLRASSVFAEAESFNLPEGWRAVPGHGIDMYTPAVSGSKTVHNSGEGTATLDVTIPRDGAYAMWVWFTKWVHDRSFELRVEQDGKVVATSVFNRPDDKQGAWSYHLQKGDNVANLKAGPARLILYGLPFGGYVGSPIDAVLLTSATEYSKPDWHDFSPQTFVRFTVLTPQAPSVRAVVTSSWHHDPWWSAAPDIAGADGNPVPPNTPSAWSDISKALDTAESIATIRFTFKGDKPMPPLWKLRLELASKPDEKARVKTIEEEWDGDTASYIMPGDAIKYQDRIESIIQATERHLDLVNGFKLPGGEGDHRPKIISIEGSADSYSPRLRIRENQVLAEMGHNAVPYHILKQVNGKGVTMDAGKSWEQHFIHDIGLTNCSFDPALQAKLEKTLTDWAANLKANDPVEFKNVRVVILADEPGTPNGLSHIVAHELDHAPFREWLKARKATPQQFGFNDWSEVKPVMPDPKASVEMRRLGMLSSLFAQETAPLPYKRATQIVQKAFGRPIETRANFSDEALNGFGSTMSNGNGFNWFEFGRQNATTIPWSEDFLFSNPHLTPFLVDILRSTKTTQNTPLGMYIIYGFSAHKDPHSAQLRTMTAAARGVKYFNHYWYGPHYASTEVAFSEDEGYVKSVAYGNRVLGLADDVLGKAMPPARKVAILWSQTTEQWKTDDAFTVERRMLHHALSMQQIPVDFIDEKDLLSRLNEYRVLYLPANNLPSECVRALDAWVKAGGNLIVCGGGPERGEANEPSKALLPVLGLQNVEMRKDELSYRGETYGLAGVKATTEAIVAGKAPTDKTTAIPVAGYKALLTPTAGARVLATYKEGGAAAVEYPSGKGRALTFGFNPGLSLLIKMEPGKLARPQFWNVFPDDELKLISTPVFAAGVQRPVSTQVGVDAARLDGPNGAAVTLANFTLQPIPRLRLQVRDVSKVTKVVSSVRGPLSFTRAKDVIVIELPLDTVDVVKLYKSP